jgi:hypothetical protein
VISSNLMWTHLLQNLNNEEKRMTRNWTPNEGDCPVDEGTVVDVIHRDGEVYKRETVNCLDGRACCGGIGNNWALEEMAGDIIFWRISKEKK